MVTAFHDERRFLNNDWRNTFTTQVLKFVAVTIFLILSTPVTAHEPYYTQAKQLRVQSGETLSIKLLHGDGIFFADPIRAIIVNSAGNLLAVSPMSRAFFLSCRETGSENECVVYDELRALIHSVNWDQIKETVLAEKDGIPQLYPEYERWMPEEYGFKTRTASFLEILKYETLGIIASPLKTFFAVSWWSVFMINLAPLFWKLRINNWRIQNVTGRGIIETLFRIGLFWVYVFMAEYYWLLSPYSRYFLILTLLIGTAIVYLLTRPRIANTR